jgi:hypothetical protein
MKKNNYGGVEEDLSGGAILGFFLMCISFFIGITYILSLG